jgi:hypothetical protein
MADKLDWMNKHLVLLRYLTVEEAVLTENYKIRPDLAEMFTGVTSGEAMTFKFAGAEKYKEACEFLPYIAHRRAAVWWGYRCVLSLMEELRINPAEDRDIADIATNFTPTVPDFAKIEIPKQDPAVKAQLDAALANARSQSAQMRSRVDPVMLKYVEDSVEVAFREFEQVHGIHPVELLKQVGARVGERRNGIDPNSPMILAAAALKKELAGIQKDTTDLIKSVIPPKVPAHEKMLRDNALSAVYRWVAAPDAENSQKCLDVGNECPDTPAGLLCLSAFWAFGNLMPLGEQTVPTPPGLAANGLSQVLLMCALHKGGTRKLKERYEEYFRLGVEVFTGADNWEASLATGKMPHEEISAGTLPAAAPQVSPAASQNGAAAAPYKRWKTNGGAE